MRRLISLAFAATAAFVATAATAADMAPPVLRESIPAVQPVDNGGWYLRGDVGLGDQHAPG